MVYLALSAKKLQCLIHHPLWGLQFNGSNARTLYDDALHLHAYPRLREKMIGSVASILQRSGWLGWLLEGFYWMFNVDQYRTNYYTLQGYFSWRLYEEGITMLSEQAQHQAQKTGGFFIEPSDKHDSIVESLLNGVNHVASSMKFVAYTLLSPLSWFAATVLSRFSEQKFPMGQLDVSKTHFEVNSDMILALNALGIDAFAGQLLLYSDLKAAYRESRLKTHPDRKQGNHEDFIRIQSAYEELTHLIQTPSDSIGLPYELKKYFSDLDEQTDELKIRYNNLKSDVKYFDNRLHQYCEHAAQFSQRVDEHVSHVAEFSQRIDEHVTNIDKHVTRVAEFSQLVDKHIEQVTNVAILCEQMGHDINELDDRMTVLTALLREKGYELPVDEDDDSQENTSEVRNPNRLFASSNTNKHTASSSNAQNLSEVDDSVRVHK